ncbi:MAG TPA: sulfite exporter TauE/SafE family protein [Halothiobacillaceae bacterium]|nr:sulfite exporter TauE/SafE family protein [Halothiobacillaceae bacterium]
MTFLPSDLEPLAALLLVAASMGTSFVTAAFGIGGGVMLVAVMAVLLPPAALIPVHGVVQLGSNGGRALIMLKHVERSTIAPFVVGSALGAGLGGVLFVQFPPWLVQLGLAGFITWSALGRLPAIGRGHVFAAGAVSSFLTMFFGATGSFVAATVRGMRLPPLDHLATHSTLMTLQHLLKSVVFGVLGFAFGPWLPFIAAMIASGFIGTLLGRHLLVRMGHRYFQPVLSGILLLMAARLAWSGVAGMLAA